jgi:uncharacterized membrane protein YbhN (UPF0104 family)
VIIIAVKLVLGSLIIAWLIRTGRLEFAVFQSIDRHESLWLVLVMLAVLFLSFSIIIARWRPLLGIQGLHLSWDKAMRVGYQGLFANILLPGSLGLDGLRILQVRRQFDRRLAEGSASIIIDRVIGLLGMLVLGSIAGTAYCAVSNDPAVEVLAIAMSGMTAAVMAFIALVCGLIPVRYPAWIRRFEFTSQLASSFSLYRNFAGKLLVSLVASVVAHLINCIAWYLGLLVLGHDVSILAIFMLTPILLVLISLPITPLGIGVADGAAEYLFALIGISVGAELQMLMRVMTLVVLILSGSAFFWRRKRVE